MTILFSHTAISASQDYVTRVWQVDAGLPENSVTAVVQTRDGYLWLGTRGGLARFDGVRFTVFDNGNTPELRSPHVTCLFEDDAGALWIGHETGEVTRYQEGKFHSVPIRGSWRGGKIMGIAADLDGDVWLFGETGELLRVKDGQVIPALPDRVTHLLSMAHGPGQGFWIQRDDEVATVRKGRLQVLAFDDSATNRYIQGIGPSRDGGLWVMTDNHIKKWKDGQWTEDDWAPAPWSWVPVNKVLETADGRLVAATSGLGLFIVARNQPAIHLSRNTGYPDDWVTSLCEDREGNLWTGTGNSGLAMLRTANISTMDPPDDWQGRAVLSVATGPDDALWVGTEGAGLYRFQHGKWSHFDETTGVEHHYIWSVAFGTQGRMWLGTWGGGLLEAVGLNFTAPEQMAGMVIPALLPEADGGVLVGTRTGLLRYRAGQVTWLARQPDVPLPDVRAISETADGAIWFGMSGSGLGCLKDGALRQFHREDGLCSDFVQCLYADSDGTLWIGTYGGLNRLKHGSFSSITTRQGLPDNTVCGIEPDGQGFLWLSSHRGIFRVATDELNQCADGNIESVHCLSYGLSDGLPTLQCSGGFQPSSCRLADGRLLFPTSKGLVAVDPSGVRTNQLAPPVVIERLLVDDQLAAEGPTLDAPVEIAAGRHRFEFQFTGLSFVAPEKVRFKYRLEGLDTAWLSAQAIRRAYYSHIPPGRYEFQVIACNNDGVWNNDAATLALVVQPFFWQTWWFRITGGVLTALAGGGIVWLDARRRTRRKLERLERQRAVEHERSRIARDIHDDLGSHLTRITMLSESAHGDLESTGHTNTDIVQIYETARDLTRAMDEIVWAVNPKHDTLESLASYLERFALDFLGTAGIRSRLDFPIEFPKWLVTAEVRHNLFLAYKEALNNVVRHARATEVKVHIELGADGFDLTIEDNGCGFDASQRMESGEAENASGGNGLRNMERRLTEVGGHCRIHSIPGTGTRITFAVRAGP